MKKEKLLTNIKLTTEEDLKLFWNKSVKSRGWVYISVNDIKPSVLKIGISQKDPFIRAKSLTTAGVEGCYKPLFALMYVDCWDAETTIHRDLSQFNLEKELFNVDFDIAKEVLVRKFKADESLLKPFNLSFLLFDQTPNRWLSQLEEANKM